MAARIRQPVVVVLGHVDSGKTSLLDKIRGTAVQAREAGGMTQHIGASFFPLATLKEICGPLLSKIGGEVKVPGVLVIDTPGHEVFTNLRSRGGSAADISVLVVDATRGFEVQTYESIEILKARKVPFVVALNKIDVVPGWRSGKSQFMSESIKVQSKEVVDDLDQRIYQVVGNLSRLGFNSEAFYRIKDFTKEIAIVPVSAKTGEGIPELMAMLIGLTQQYLQNRLTASAGLPRGIVLEIEEELGLGYTANIILLDGILRTGDSLVLAKREGAIVSKVKAVFMPKPLDEMRDPRDKFVAVNEVVSTAGVKIVTQDLEGVLPGSPFGGLDDPSHEEELKKQIESEVASIFIKTESAGLIVKSDTIGSLEALVQLLKAKNTPIRIADIGPVSRRDVVEASTVRRKNPYQSVILAFGVRILPDALAEADISQVKIFTDPIIYSLIQSYFTWVENEKEVAERNEFSRITQPCKFKILKGYVFRRSGPSVVGVEVLSGVLKQKGTIMNVHGQTVGSVHQIQDQGKGIAEANKGMQVAVSMNEPIVGRHIHEDESLYTLPNDDEIKLLLNKYPDRLQENETQTMNEIIAIRRKVVPLYGF